MDLTPQALVLLQPALVDDIATDDASALAILNAQNSRKLREQCQAILFLVNSAIKNATNVAYTIGVEGDRIVHLSLPAGFPVELVLLHANSIRSKSPAWPGCA